MKLPHFIGGSYRSASKIADDSVTMNFYPEIMESPGAKSQMVLYPTPGVTAFTTAGTQNPVRGLWSQDGRTLAAFGGTLYELLADGTKTYRGTIANDGSPVTFSTNGDGGGEVFITSGDTGYVFTLSSNVMATVLSDVTFGSFLSTRFLALDAATSTLKISDQLDGTTWDATQVVQRTIGSDAWISMLVNNREIWLFGSRTSEVWYDSGASPFPFAPISGAYIQQGILAAWSAARLSGTVLWLGSNENGAGVVYRANGYAAERISNHAMESEIQAYGTLSDALGWSYEHDGHSFYVLTFPTANKTWVYDAVSQLWHNRGYWDVATGVYKAYRPMWHAYGFGKHLVGDLIKGRVYELSDTSYVDVDSALVRRFRRGPHISQDQLIISHQLFQLDLEVGLGLASGQGSDPQIMLRWSDDGGQTWGNEHWKSAGKIGKYRTRAKWTRLGSSRDRVYEIAMTDPVPWRIIDAYIGASTGTS